MKLFNIIGYELKLWENCVQTYSMKYISYFRHDVIRDANACKICTLCAVTVFVVLLNVCFMSEHKHWQRTWVGIKNVVHWYRCGRLFVFQCIQIYQLFFNIPSPRFLCHGVASDSEQIQNFHIFSLYRIVTSVWYVNYYRHSAWGTSIVSILG